MASGIPIIENYKKKKNVYSHTAKPSPEKWRSKSWCSGSKGSSWNIRNASMLSSPVASETIWLPPPHFWWAEEHFCLACGVFSPRHRTLVSLSIHYFFTHTSAYCPTPSTFNHIKSSPHSKYGSVSTVAFQVARIHFVLHISGIYKWRHAREGDQTRGEDAF